MLNEIVTNSKGIFRANTLVLPPQQYEFIATQPYAEDYRGISILTELLSNFPGLKVEYAVELQGASSITPSNDVMIAYEKNVEYACHALPLPFEILEGARSGVEFQFLGHARTAGVIIRQPLSLIIKEGI
jgi:hypothetical protein